MPLRLYLPILISVFNLLFIETTLNKSENNSRDYHSDSLSNILNLSPDLRHVDIIHLIPSSNFSISKIPSSNELSIATVDFLLSFENPQVNYTKSFSTTDHHHRPTIFYFSQLKFSNPQSIQEISQVATMLENHNLHWVHTIIEYYAQPNVVSDFTQFKNLSQTFQLNNRLHLLMFQKKPQFTSISITEIYSIKDVNIVETFPLKMYSILSYASNGGYNFRRALIKATAVDSPENNPVVTYSTETSSPTFIRGLGVFDLWDIRDILNFTVEAIKGVNDISANETNNGLPAEGIGRQLYDGEADVSILHTYHLVDNVRYLHPLVAMGEDRVFAIFRQPPSFSVRNAFVKPFQGDVWKFIICIWIGLIFCLFIFSYLLTTTIQFSTEQNWNPTAILLWAVATFCQRSFFWLPRSISLRILLLYGLIFSLATYLIYSAQIISSFTAEFLPIKDLSNLIENNFQIYSDPKDFYSYILLKEPMSREEYASKFLFAFKSELESTSEVTTGFKMHFNTLDSLYLFARELNYSDREICQIYSFVPLGSITLKSGFYVKKNSPFQEPFSLRLLTIMERGLNGRYIRNYYRETLVKCQKTKTRYREDLGISDVFTAFAVLTVAMFLSISILGIELSVRYKCKNVRINKCFYE